MINHAYVLCGGDSSRFLLSVRNEIYRREDLEHRARSDFPRIHDLPDDLLLQLKDVKKIFAPLFGKTILEHHLAMLAKMGIRSFTLLAGQNSSQVDSIESRLKNYGEIEVARNPAPDLICLQEAVRQRGDQEVLMTYGDCLAVLDFNGLYQEFIQDNSIAEYALQRGGFGDFAGLAIFKDEFFERAISGYQVMEWCKDQSPLTCAIRKTLDWNHAGVFRGAESCININTLKEYSLVYDEIIRLGRNRFELEVPFPVAPREGPRESRIERVVGLNP